MPIEILDEITSIEMIAADNSIREIARLRKFYGTGRWRKLKGVATIQLADGTTCRAELHWYEAHGIGRKEIKIRRLIPDE